VEVDLKRRSWTAYTTSAIAHTVRAKGLLADRRACHGHGTGKTQWLSSAILEGHEGLGQKLNSKHKRMVYQRQH
jgi:hypothetical protein